MAAGARQSWEPEEGEKRTWNGGNSPWGLRQCAGLAGQGARRTHPGREGWV